MSGRRLRTVVADTSALVSLAVSRADATVDTDVPDPFQALLTSRGVFVPPDVVPELWDITQHQDIHAAAATNVLAARSYDTVEHPYEREETPDSRPTFGLEDGIVLANALGVGGCLTDEFGGTNFPPTPCCRARGSARRHGSSSTTPTTDI